VSSSHHERREHLEQLRRARQKLDQRQLPAPGRDQADFPGSEQAWADLVERRIQEAMAAGAFDNLPGHGKPLNLDRNPYLDPSLDLAYGLLQHNGYTPEWIARDKEIRQELEAARARLRAAWARRCAHPAEEATWQAALARFEESLGQLNAKIDVYNLMVPIPSCQRVRLRLAEELAHLDHE